MTLKAFYLDGTFCHFDSVADLRNYSSGTPHIVEHWADAGADAGAGLTDWVLGAVTIPAITSPLRCHHYTDGNCTAVVLSATDGFILSADALIPFSPTYSPEELFGILLGGA